MTKLLSRTGLGAGMLAVFTTLTTLAGCERKQKVLEVETPGAKLEINRSEETGNIDIEIERDRAK